MSFWPFSNSLNANSCLQKFLDSVQDTTMVTAEDLLGDAEMLAEVVSELHNIKGNYGKNAHNFPFQQQLQQQHTKDHLYVSQDLLSSLQEEDENALTPVRTHAADSASVSLFSEASSPYGKDARGVKLLEILIQPHVLSGFLDYLVDSVAFFRRLENAEEEEVRRLMAGISPEVDSDETMEAALHPKEDEAQPAESADDRFRRCVQAACDILLLDLWIVSNRIIETPAIMAKLWLVLELGLLERLPSVLYLVHILDQLMEANSIELLNFVRRQPRLVDTFLAKVDIPVLMDFFLRVIQTDRADLPTGVVDTLHLQRLVPKLVEILKPQPHQFAPSVSGIADPALFFRQTAATDFLKALITISSNAALALNLETNIGPNQLTRELASRAVVRTLVEEVILYRPPHGATNKHGINNCVGIFIELIRKNNSDYDSNCGSYSSMLHHDSNAGGSEVNAFVMFQWLRDFEQNPPGERDPVYLGEMLEVFLGCLPQVAEVMSAAGGAGGTLGFTAFKLSELVAELLHCSNMILLNSKKIRRVIEVRERVRPQQSRRLQRALNEPLEDDAVHTVTHGVDDVSLDKEASSAATLDTEVVPLEAADSDDEEPVISPENPFVGPERDALIRASPCLGDAFKVALLDLGLLQHIVGRLTEFPWHNFYHNIVFDLIQQVFNGKLNSYNSFLIVELFQGCHLTEVICNAYDEVPLPRPGYMGHLILISEEIVKFTSLYKPDLISGAIVAAVSTREWEQFVSDTLMTTREVYNAVLGTEDTMGLRRDDDDDGFGFDASTVGYLDLDGVNERNRVIVLGDRQNHDEFVAEQPGDAMEEAMPTMALAAPARVALEDDAEDAAFPATEFLGNLSGSSLDEEEGEEE